MTISKTAIRKYNKFHGKPVKRFSTLNLPSLKHLVYLANAHAIEYVSDKCLTKYEQSKRTNKRKRLYRHKFGNGVKIYSSTDGKTLLIKGGRLKVTDWLRW